MPKIHIDEVYPKDVLYPMAVSFQNGYASDNFPTKTCFLHEDTKTGEKILSTEIANMIYTAKEIKQDLGKTLILARDRTTGKTRLIELGIADLRPVVNNDSRTLPTDLDTSSLELSRKFGSKKHKKMAEQREKLKVNVSTVMEQMHNVTVNVTDEQVDLSSYSTSNSDEFYIPPINHEAAKAEEVYDIYKILTKEQYDKIYSEMTANNYTSELEPWMKKMVTKELTEELTVLALYASCLFKLNVYLLSDIKKKDFITCNSSATLNDIIMKNFITSVNGKRSRPAPYKDKAFCHALVFLLLLNNLKYDVQEACENLKFCMRTVCGKFRITGATISTTNNRQYAQLKLPLSRAVKKWRKSAKF